MRFPNGKPKALTLSYDDGIIQDKRLIEILNRYGLKATFNLNSGLYPKEDVIGKGRMSAKQTRETYIDSGHEVACHGLTHQFLDRQPMVSVINEVFEDRKNLEEMFGRQVCGMAYPYGAYSDGVIETLKNSGILYSRTCISTHDFRIPTDWLRLTATCHHTDSKLSELTERFVSQSPDDSYNKTPWLFYLWGHSYEFDECNNWELIEDFCEKTGGKNDIWYATNIEVYDYVEAFRSLRYSARCNRVYNPTAITVWLYRYGRIYTVGSGETIDL